MLCASVGIHRNYFISSAYDALFLNEALRREERWFTRQTAGGLEQGPGPGPGPGLGPGHGLGLRTQSCH